MENETILQKLDYSIEEIEKDIKDKEGEYKNKAMGTGAVDLMLQTENLKGQLRAFKEIRLFIKHNK